MLVLPHYTQPQGVAAKLAGKLGEHHNSSNLLESCLPSVILSWNRSCIKLVPCDWCHPLNIILVTVASVNVRLDATRLFVHGD